MTINNSYCDVEKLYIISRNKTGYKGFYQLVVKRLIDIFAGLIASPMVLLLTVPIAIAIKIEDGGPVFYVSKRIGKDFKEFGMLKFRSMIMNAPDIRNDDGSTYNSQSDSRVTKIGRFLRETSLDEIPQVFNIILGDMSIIGPRPGDIESRDTYSEDEKDKMLVRPGLTGYCQAYFRNAAGVREKRLYDGVYAHCVTFWLDVKIFVKTIISVTRKKNIYTN